jgi:hypothetical protein
MVIRSEPEGFDAALLHVEMLDDRARTSVYIDALREVIRPDDVVVDIGTGTGVLAVAAARAGARHVYAVEASSIGTLAKAVFEANGLSERITLIKGWSTQIELPERADVLVSEIIGNEPLGENVLEVTSDALKRLLNPNPRLVPGRLQIFGLAVTIPFEDLREYTFTKEALSDWQNWYGIDFSPLGAAVQTSAHMQLVRPHSARKWHRLSQPILLADVDFAQLRYPKLEPQTVTAVAEVPGQLNGFVVYFELQLSSKVRLSTHPDKADRSCSWRLPVWIRDPLPLQPSDRFCVSYKYRGMGKYSEVSISRA